MVTQIGLFEAKTKLSEIVHKAGSGQRFTITIRGKAVADLVPAQNDSRENSGRVDPAKLSPEEREAAFERLRHPKIAGVPGDTILEWIREGRK
jgi:antitoxin (DNA-binding transcriptional repressor) of toxin-antitoxin stability system